MKRPLQWVMLTIGLAVIMAACGALTYTVWPINRQSEQVRPAVTLFVPPP